MEYEGRLTEAWSRIYAGKPLRAEDLDLEKEAFIATALALGKGLRAAAPYMARGASALKSKALPWALKAGVVGASASRFLGKAAPRASSVTGQAYKTFPEQMDKVAPTFISDGRRGARMEKQRRQMQQYGAPDLLPPVAPRRPPGQRAPARLEQPLNQGYATRGGVPRFFPRDMEGA